MKRTNLIWHILLPGLAIAIAAMAALAWYASVRIRAFHYESTREHLSSAGRLAAGSLAGMTGEVTRAAAQGLCNEFGRALGYRLTVIRPDGQVLGDSEHDPAVMDNHGDRPEIRDALARGDGHEIRYSDTGRLNMMYVASPVMRNGVNVAVVRVALSLSDIDAAITAMRHRILLAGVLIAALTVAVSLVVSRRVTHPLQAMCRAARGLADGDLAVRVPSSRIAEIAVLADTINHTAAQLARRIETIQRQRDEHGAVLASMVEAVLAVDTHKRLIRMNRSAAQLFRFELAAGEPPEIASVIRNADLLHLVGRTLDAAGAVEGEVHLEEGDIYLRAHGAALHEADGRKIGALIVLHDVTRLRRLETMRSDFVANVSHELKTPVTSIKGFAETLLDGASENKEDRDRFIGIIKRQADRLEAIIEDLLVLSRIEHGTEQRDIAFDPGRIDRVMERAVQTCLPRAAAAGMRLRFEGGQPMEAAINVQLLEQAVLNLLDNAIKYSGPDTEIVARAAVMDDAFVLSVTDQGRGIAARHLPRIFERFYRVDKSRSRELGGTGLGLAIVKRIAIAHGGRVEVESEIDKGSVFRIVLPKKGRIAGGERES